MSVYRSFFLGNEQYLNPKYRILVSGYNANGTEEFAIEGNVSNELSVAGNNDFGSERGEAIQGVVGDVSRNLGKVGSVVGAAAGLVQSANTYSQAASGRALVSRTMSEVVWQGSGKPEFSIDLTFVCLDSQNPRESVVNRVGTLMRMVYPDGNELLTPPLGYSVSKSGAGKVALKIGDWFFADKLICTGCNFNFSKEVNYFGEPLYAVGSITLTTYRLINYKEFVGYFNQFQSVFKNK